jgi:hypothetical protein
VTIAGGLAALAGIAVVALVGRSAVRPPPVVRLPAVLRLRTGDCVDSGPNGVSKLRVVSCTQPHDSEVYATFALAGKRWPGTAKVSASARSGCTARLGSYLNPQLAAALLTESYAYPSHGAWKAGERTVVCEVSGTSGKLTGSVRGLH